MIEELITINVMEKSTEIIMGIIIIMGISTYAELLIKILGG
jgi:hypothetical protein